MTTVRISSDVNRILFVKNLNYKTTGEDIYDLFGKCVHACAECRRAQAGSSRTSSRRYGSIRQVRKGTEGKAKGTAFVVYEDVMDVSRDSLSLLGVLLRFVRLPDPSRAGQECL